MRVRILKDFSAGGRKFRAGEVVHIDFQEAYEWAKSGLVMQDKSLDGAMETKASLDEASEAEVVVVPRKRKRRTRG